MDEFELDSGLLNGDNLTTFVSRNGVSSLYSATYKAGDTITDSFYDGIGTTVTNEIPIIIGRVLLKGVVSDSGSIRSDLDPTKIQKVYQFISGEGPIKGIAGSNPFLNDPNNVGKLQNIYVNGKPVANSSGVVEVKNVGFKEFLGTAAIAAGTVAAANYVAKILDTDPTTGSKIDDKLKGIISSEPVKADINSLNDFNVGAANDKDIMVYDRTACKWTNKSFVDVFQNSGIGVQGDVTLNTVTTVQSTISTAKNGTVVNAATSKLNFIGDNITVTDAGNGQVNIGVTSSTGTPTPTPTPTPTVDDCSNIVAVWNGTTTAIPAGTVVDVLKNGVLDASYTYPRQYDGAEDIQVGVDLARTALIASLNAKYPFLSDSRLGSVTSYGKYSLVINDGTDSCLGSKIGSSRCWTSNMANPIETAPPSGSLITIKVSYGTGTASAASEDSYEAGETPASYAKDRVFFTVEASPAVTSTVKVQYQTIDGTAKANQDYTAQTGTITFSPSDNIFTRTDGTTYQVRYVYVDIINDYDLTEGLETLGLQLFNPSGAGHSFNLVSSNSDPITWAKINDGTWGNCENPLFTGDAYGAISYVVDQNEGNVQAKFVTKLSGSLVGDSVPSTEQSHTSSLKFDKHSDIPLDWFSDTIQPVPPEDSPAYPTSYPASTHQWYYLPLNSISFSFLGSQSLSTSGNSFMNIFNLVVTKQSETSLDEFIYIRLADNATSEQALSDSTYANSIWGNSGFTTGNGVALASAVVFPSHNYGVRRVDTPLRKESVVFSRRGKSVSYEKIKSNLSSWSSDTVKESTYFIPKNSRMVLGTTTIDGKSVTTLTLNRPVILLRKDYNFASDPVAANASYVSTDYSVNAVTIIPAAINYPRDVSIDCSLSAKYVGSADISAKFFAGTPNEMTIKCAEYPRLDNSSNYFGEFSKVTLVNSDGSNYDASLLEQQLRENGFPTNLLYVVRNVTKKSSPLNY